MTKIEVVNKTGKRIKKTFVQEVVKKTLDISGKKPRNFSVAAVFAEKKEIQRLNRIYRKKNKSTDVLSFDYSSEYNKKRIEGELFLCPEMIEKSAREHKVSFQKELTFVLSHGVLHLLGMKHGRKMYELQDRVSTNYEICTKIRNRAKK